MTAAKMPAIGDAIAIEWGTVDLPNAMEFKITRCAFAEFFRALGEPELGARRKNTGTWETYKYRGQEVVTCTPG